MALMRKAASVPAAPAGPVTPDGPGRWSCAAGWTVTGASADLAPLLGPQAPAILSVLALAEEALTDPGPSAAWDAYMIASGAVYTGAAAADAAARRALAQAGADAAWWDTIGNGPEILALAARDLIGTAAGWTQAAYDLLTRPWAEAFGPAHPGDRATTAAGQ
jgi:hypothetical protein